VSSGLRQRIGTGLLLAALVIVILLGMPPAVAVAAVMVVVAAGAWEWAGFAGIASQAGRIAYAAAVMLGVAAAWRLTRAEAALVVVLSVAAAWWIAAVAWLVLAPARGGPRVAAIVGFVVLVPAALGLGRLAELAPNGQVLLLFLLVLIAAADIGAYFGGRRFGRRKLAPRISPNKTWEGFWSGVAAAGCAAVIGGALLGEPLLPWVAVCVAVALASVVGDLVESMFKRQAGLKDSSSLLPGHGGVLDRLDSLSAAGPMFLLGLLLLGKG
jgi:phosphatidate cytidylyltransferase